MKANRLFAIATACGLVAFAASGCQKSKTDSTDPPAVQVTTVKPQKKTIRRTTVQPGQIEPFEQAKIFAKIAGYIDSVAVDIGDKVRGPRFDDEGKLVEKGQVLAELSVPELKQELQQKKSLTAQADAEVLQAQATVKVAKSGVTTAQADVKQLTAATARVEADFQRWQSEYSRVKQMAAKSAVTEKLVDETKNQLDSADAARAENLARVEGAKAAVAASQAQLEKAIADEAAVHARRDVALADQARIEAMADYMQLRAPFNGTVTERNFDLGALMQPGGGTNLRAMFSVMRNDIVRVFVNVPELDAPLVAKDNRATIRVPALAGQEFTGGVSRSSWALDNDTRTLRTEIDIPNSTGVLRPGMYVQVSLVLVEKTDAITLPAAAVLEQDKQAWCFAVADGKAVRKPLVVGSKSGEDVEIVSGLKGDETVISPKVTSLIGGQAVRVAEPPPAKKSS